VLGNIYIYGGSTPQASIATTFVKMTGFDGDSPVSTPEVIEPDYANDRIVVKKAGAGDVGAAPAEAPMQLEVDDYVEIYVKSDNGGGVSMTPVYASFTLSRAGD
jgi:hypothetical protein